MTAIEVKVWIELTVLLGAVGREPMSKFMDWVDQQLQTPTKWTAVFLNLYPGTFGQRLQSLLWYLFLRLSIGRHC
jgi:hypothetical protein